MGPFDRRGWRVLVALLVAASAMVAVALWFPPEASDAVAGGSTAIATTVTGGPTAEAVIPGRVQLNRLGDLEGGFRVRGLVLVAALAAGVLAHGPIRRRSARRHAQSDPAVLLRTLSAPRRGPPPLQFV